MIFKKTSIQPVDLVNVHEGTGKLTCLDMLKGHVNAEHGFRFVHDNILEPGATVGEHLHQGDEEIYFILDGKGIMIEDGEEFEIHAGDLSLVQSGHTHGLRNSPQTSMRFLVIGVA